MTRTLFLKYILTSDGLEINLKKIRIILEWPSLKRLKNL